MREVDGGYFISKEECDFICGEINKMIEMQKEMSKYLDEVREMLKDMNVNLDKINANLDEMKADM